MSNEILCAGRGKVLLLLQLIESEPINCSVCGI
jgi:hypothetical protein